MAPDCIAVRSDSDKFGSGDRLLPTTDRSQKAFSHSSLVLNEVVLRTRVNKVYRGKAEPYEGLRRSPLARLFGRLKASRYPTGEGAKPSNILSKNPESSSCWLSSSAAARPTATFSQSGATASSVSAITRSKPLPHVTKSLFAGLLKRSNTSLPSPPLRVSVAPPRR